MVRRLVGHAERGRHAVVHLVGDRCDRPGSDDHLVGEGADEARAEDALADDHVLDALADLGDHAGELAARDEGQGRRHLVRVGDHQQVGEVDGADVDPDPDLAGAERRRFDVRDGNDLRPAVGGAQRGTHAADPYANTE